MSTLQIGTFTLLDDTVYRKSYETASWYTDIQVPAGEYALTTDGYWMFVKMDGIIVAHWTPSSFGGVQYGTHPNPTDHPTVGQPGTYHIQTYDYIVSGLLAENRGYTKHGQYKLDEGFQVVCTRQYWGQRWNPTTKAYGSELCNIYKIKQRVTA